MEDTKKTKRTTSKNKNKNNHEPRWKAKKEGTANKTKEQLIRLQLPKRKLHQRRLHLL